MGEVQGRGDEQVTIDDIIYHSGLSAQGCWDQLDTYTKEAIERAIKMALGHNCTQGRDCPARKHE